MEKLWAGRSAGALDPAANDINASIAFDSKMIKEDITGSMAHAAMLAAQGIIAADDSDKIIEGLAGILADIESGALPIDMSAEDVHTFVETELIRRIGEVGKRLHTARSRNDQVATDLRLYLREEAAKIGSLLNGLIAAIYEKASENTDTILPGYTHLQRAQPVTFAHHLLAYAMMFIRDAGRLSDAAKRMNVSPLGSCALAGTNLSHRPTDDGESARLRRHRPQQHGRRF